MQPICCHLCARREVARFGRCWLLVEGETEFWILPELARIHGYHFSLEGIAVVEFAQCGLAPLIHLARELGIQWHVLTDGDRAGSHHADTAIQFIGGDPKRRRLTRLRDPDMEHCVWHHGYASVLISYLDQPLCKLRWRYSHDLQLRESEWADSVEGRIVIKLWYVLNAWMAVRPKTVRCP